MYDNTIQSVHRAALILNLFSYHQPRLGISDIGRALKLSKGTVQGLIRTLTQDGFLQQDKETRKYQLGLKIYELGVILAGNLEINQKASNPANQLAKRTKRLVHIAIPDKYSALITMDAYPRSQPFISPQFGPRAPLYCTALGKALLAFFGQSEIDSYLEWIELIPYTSNTITRRDKLLEELKEIRERGYSINQEEHILGRAAIGAPIFGRTGYPSASMCLVVDPGEVSKGTAKRLVKEVMDTALEISRLMGFFNSSVLLRGSE